MPKRPFVFLLLMLTLTSSGLAQYQPGSPWPKFQADNSNTGRAIASPPNGVLKWSVPIGDNFHSSSPVIAADGTIILAGGGGVVWGMNPDGSLAWAYENFSETFYGSPAIGADGTIYIEGAHGNVYALSSTGSHLWTRPTGGTFSGNPSIGTDGLLYVANGGALDVIATGPSGGQISNPFSTQGECFACALGSSGDVFTASLFGLAAFEESGSNLWKLAQADDFATGGLALSSGLGQIYLAESGPTLWVISQGGIALDQASPGAAVMGSPAIDSNGIAYFATTNGNIEVVTGPSQETLFFSAPIPDSFLGSPIVGPDNTIYICGNSGNVYAINPDGTLKWTCATYEPLQGTPAIGADGTLYVGGVSGGLYAIGAADYVAGLSVSPATVIGGIGSVGTISLGNVAPTGGWTVNLTSDSSCVSVPTTISAPAGATSATFAITTTQPSTPAAVTITASDFGSSQSATLQVYTDYVMGVTLSPQSVSGGANSFGTVSIYQPAPTGGYVVNLASEYPGSVGVPAAVTVPTGLMTASFTVTTKRFANTFNCDIYASDGTSGTQATLIVVGDSISSLSINPTTIGGDQFATGTITLATAAPSAGWIVNLSTEYPSSVGVPATVTVPSGATTATFSITPVKQFSNTFVCDVYASDGGSATQAGVTIVGDSLASLSLSPTSVVGGTSSTGTITLTSNAPSGGWTVNVSTEYPSSDKVPAKVIVPAGSLTATFTITTSTTSSRYGCDVYAADGNSGKQATLTVTPR